MNENNTRSKPWLMRSHFAIVALVIFITGLALILLSQQTSFVVLGATALILAHLAAFGGLILYGGGWIKDRFRKNK